MYFIEMISDGISFDEEKYNGCLINSKESMVFGDFWIRKITG